MPASRTASGVGFGLAVLLSCAQARAYQSPTRFADPSDMGGGGGRYFTGSPADSYTCVVCHSAGTPTHLKILGLPVNGYTPGLTYRITVDWDDTLKSVAMNLEMTNRAGQTLGALSMPGPDQLADADLCKPVTNGLPDMHVLTTMEGRMIGVVPECGGNQGTVIWTAPMNAPGTGLDAEAWFSGSLVSADGNGKVDADNTTDFTRVIGLRNQSAPKPSLLAGGCSATVRGDEPQDARSGVAALGCLAVLALRRRRRARHSSHGAR